MAGWLLAAGVTSLLGLSAGCRGPDFTSDAGGAGVGAAGPGTSTQTGVSSECEPEEGRVVGNQCGAFVQDGQSGAGSKSSPYGRISQALAAGHTVIYVCGPSADTQSLVVPGGTAIFGGLDCTDWSFSLTSQTTVVGSPGIAVKLQGGSGTRLEGLRIVATSNVNNRDAIALVADNIEASISRCAFEAGNGTTGRNGTPGATGAAGSNGGGAAGSSGGAGGQAICGGGGGKGGDAIPTPMSGGVGLSTTVGGGASGAAGCTVGGPGGSGGPPGPTPGRVGKGTLSPAGYAGPVGMSGAIGVHAAGGGGGGASTNNPGGGGGGGGCGGNGGSPGENGGSSIAIVAIAATLAFTSSTASVGSGGNGGAGGAGGAGGGGGSPGSGTCSGGVGGTGGGGAQGSGGIGGHAIVVAYTGSAPDVAGLTFTDPAAAQAGNGSGNSANGLADDIVSF